jgi:hypothetical protein
MSFLRNVFRDRGDGDSGDASGGGDPEPQGLTPSELAPDAYFEFIGGEARQAA